LWSRNETAVAEAAALAHHLEKSLLLTRIQRLTDLLKEHNIEVAQDDPLLGASDIEHLKQCRSVVIHAYDLLQSIKDFETALRDLRTTVGSGMELVGGNSWRT
jgi:hypothetical protein